MFAAHDMGLHRDGVEVLAHVTLNIAPGEHVRVFGRSGSGKSSLLETLVGLIPSSRPGALSGEVICNGRTTSLFDTAELVQGIAVALEDPESQFSMLSVRDELAFSQSFLTGSTDEGRIRDALGRFGIADLIDRSVRTLSQGEKRLTTLACVAAAEPAAVVLDDPTLGLDQAGRKRVAEYLNDQKATSTQVVATHDPSLVEGSLAVRMLVLERGRLRDDARAEGDSRKLQSTLRDAYPLVNRIRSVPKWENGASGAVPLRLQDLSVRSRSAGATITNRLSVGVKEGQILAFIGENGSGKSTLCDVIGGLTPPLAGAVELSGVPVRAVPRLRRGQLIAYALQNPDHQLIRASPRTEMNALARRDRATRELEEWAVSALDLDDAIERRDAQTLSRGQKKCLCLAAALASGSRLVVLDEPEMGLDPCQRNRLVKAIEEMRRVLGTAFVIASHDLSFLSHLAIDHTVQL